MANKKKLTRKEKVQVQQAAPAKKAVPNPAGKKQIHLLGLIVAALGFILYVNTFGHGYVLDDFSVIKENWVVRKGLDAIPLIFKTSYRHGSIGGDNTLYRPLSLVMFAAEWHFFPDKPQVSHVINVLLYALTGFLLFYVLHRLLSAYNIIIPFIASLLFIAHPVHTEVVANIKSRDEILSFIFLLLTIHFSLKYIKNETSKPLLVAAFCYFLAFLAKESAITFLAVIPLALYFFNGASLKKLGRVGGMLAIVAIVFILIRKSVLGDIKGVTNVAMIDNLLMGAPDAAHKLATAVLILGKYFLLLVFPHPLVNDYSFNQIPIVGWDNIWALLSLAFHIAIAIFAIKKFKSKNIIAFSILFYLITLSLYSNIIIIIGSSFGERFLYLPSLGFCIVLAVALAKIFKADINTPDNDVSFSSLLKSYPKVFAATGLILAAYSVKTIARNPAWESDFILYETDIKNSPNSARMHYYYGLELMTEKALNAPTEAEKQRYIDLAIEEYNKAKAIYKPYPEVYNQLGLAYYRKNNYEKAVENYNLAIKYNPGYSLAYSNLGAVYFNTRQYDKALEIYQTALKYDPHYADAYLNIGSTYGTIGKPQEAIQAFRKGLEYEPENAMLNYYLGITYQNIKDVQNAQFYLTRAYGLDPSLRK